MKYKYLGYIFYIFKDSEYILKVNNDIITKDKNRNIILEFAKMYIKSLPVKSNNYNLYQYKQYKRF